MSKLKNLLVIEDEPKDLKIAVEVANSIGILEIVARTNAVAAITYLEKCLDGSEPLPDGIILDLSLGYDSGYEILRMWHATPRLSKIPILVWSVREDNQREMCELFNVTNFVSKWEGKPAFLEALRKMEAESA